MEQRGNAAALVGRAKDLRQRLRQLLGNNHNYSSISDVNVANGSERTAKGCNQADIMGGSQTSTPDERLQWERLTDKQIACLDLLLERKTSKEIARHLGISKFTVDQRIRTARSVLGAASRDDTAIRYARLKRICNRVAYHSVDIPPDGMMVPSDFADGEQANILDMRESARMAAAPPGTSPPFGKIWRHDHALLARLLIMAVVLTTLVIFLAGSVGIAEVLSRLIAG